MEQQHHSHSFFPEVSIHHAPSEGTRRIWKTFWLLLIITLMELGLGLTLYALPDASDFLRLLLKGIIVILSLAKSFYIIAIFMHLGDEIRNMIMTVAIPALLFVWFLTAFLWDGNSFRNLRNEHDPYHLEQSKIKVKQDPEHAGRAAQHEGEVH